MYSIRDFNAILTIVRVSQGKRKCKTHVSPMHQVRYCDNRLGYVVLFFPPCEGSTNKQNMEPKSTISFYFFNEAAVPKSSKPLQQLNKNVAYKNC